MKTLMLTTLLLLAISGLASAAEPAPVAEEPVGTSTEETTGAAVGEPAEPPDGAEGESAREIVLVEPDAGQESVSSAEPDEAEGELGWMPAEDSPEPAVVGDRVAEAGVAGDTPAAPAPRASTEAPRVGEQAAADDSLMMDVGEVLDELLWPEPYLYQSAGTRDPFAPLVGQEGPEDGGPPAIGDIVVVGVVWGEDDRFALVETRGGRGLVMRAGDRVQDGRVIEVLPDGLRISHTLYGITRVVTLPVRSGLEGKDER